MIKRCALYLYEKDYVRDFLDCRHPAIIWNDCEIRNWLHNVAGFLAALRDDNHPLEELTVIIEEGKDIEYLTGKEFLNEFERICERAGCEGYNVPARDQDHIREVRILGPTGRGPSEAGREDPQEGVPGGSGGPA